MKRIGWLAATAVLAGALVACGGGSGGGSGGSTGDGENTTAPAATALPLAVRINDASMPSADSYSVKDGDTAEVSASTPVTWTSSSHEAQLSIKTINATTWKAKLIKKTSAPASVTLTASTKGGSTTLVFNLPASDARNGTYKVYATSGTRLDLKLDFDAGTYATSEGSLGDSAETGTFTAATTEPGTFVFDSPRISASYNTARFRLKGDTVVGAFPFLNKQKTETSYEVRPFAGSRALAMDRGTFDGIYNRFGINLAPKASNISQLEISGGATTLRRCGNNRIYRIEDCPAGSVLSYRIDPGTAGTWRMTDTSTGTYIGSFAMAPMNGKFALLMAATADTGLPDTLFRIALPDSREWPAGRGYGGSTSGSWGLVTLLDDGTSTRAGTTADGNMSNSSSPWQAFDGPYGMRSFGSTNGGAYFAAQGAGIFAVVGSSAPATAGYLQLNLLD